MMRRRFYFATALLFVTVALALESVPRSEYRQRRVALADKLHGGSALVFAASESQLDFTPFRQDSDFYYLSGWNEPGAALLIIGPGPKSTTAAGEAVAAHGYREILFLPARNRIGERYTGAKLDAASAGITASAGFDAVMPFTSLPEVVTAFITEDRRRASFLWSQTDLPATKAVIGFLSAALGTASLKDNDLRPLIGDLRAIKSQTEVELIRKATNASITAQQAGMQALAHGVRERTIAGIEMAKMLEAGCERPSYAPIVGSGSNATVLHYSANERTMESGDMVVIDAAGEYSMYASDITRTMPVDGHFTARQREIYEIVLGAQRAAASAFVAGKFKMGGPAQRDEKVNDTLDKIAFDYINTHGKDLHGKALGPCFLHGLGHSVGIDVHDPLSRDRTLDKGMVFTIEPGIYLPEENIGVRIEDIYYVAPDGKLVDLVATLPHEAKEVEAVMSPAKR